MKKSDKLQNWLRAAAGALLLSVVLAAGLFMDAFSIVSHADSTGKVTAASVNIRKEPSTSSEAVGTAEKNAQFSVSGQATGTDGYTWYQVSVNGATGYIRSDLMTITDSGSATSPTTSSTPTTSTPDETLVSVTPVEPVSASVTRGGESGVRVRQNASTTSRIVTTARDGLALTVTGTATGTDGQAWVQVNFISGGSEVSGFIRKDYVSVSGDLVPVDTSAQAPGMEAPELPAPEPEEVKDWDTYYEGEKWHLLNNDNGNSYDIDQIFSSVKENTETLKKTLDKNRTQQIVIIILVIVLICMAAAVSFLIFKLKDVSDSAYFNEVERETARRRTADRPAGQRPQGGQRVMQNVGAPRPAGQRPQNAGTGAPRPAGQRPQSAGTGAPRPAGQRPQSAGTGAPRPAGQRPQNAGTGAPRPVGQRPQGAGTGAPRPVNRPPVDRQEPVQPRREQPEYNADYGQDYAEQPQVREDAAAKPQGKNGWRAKNFINDDEFEFQFLDWEDDQV